MWYDQQQQAMRQDPELRWLVEARNFIEKQGDLATRSRFLVTLSNSWKDESSKEFPLAPEVPAGAVAKIIANSVPAAKVNEEALIRFERQWVDSQLPSNEVLTTLVHCYGKLRDVLLAAHVLRAPSPPECEFEHEATTTNHLLPEKMLAGEFPRVGWFKLREGKLADYETITATVTPEEAEKRASVIPTCRRLSLE